MSSYICRVNIKIRGLTCQVIMTKLFSIIFLEKWQILVDFARVQVMNVHRAATHEKRKREVMVKGELNLFIVFQ